jgi:hypothetical protein
MSEYNSSFSQDMRRIDMQLEMAFGKKQSFHNDNRQRNHYQAQQVELFMSSVGSYYSNKNGYVVSNNKNSSSYWSSDGIF